MKRPNTIRTGSLVAFFALLALFTSARLAERVVNLAGLVVNAQTMSPIESVEIFDGSGYKLGSTDKNGYYKISFNADATGDIRFELKVSKKGFQTLNQNEHWGNLGNAQNIMYFGLKASGSSARSFSSLANGSANDLGYDNVLKGFDKVRKDRDFENKLEAAKAGNENVLVQVEGKYYIVDSNGWIELHSDKDMVSIDNKQIVSADKLNSTLKRKNIKGMTPVDSKDAKFLIHTK